MKKANRILTILMFIFLYLPMGVLIVASFNTGKDITNFEGFTLQRYVELFNDDHLLSLSHQCAKQRAHQHYTSLCHIWLFLLFHWFTVR